LSVKKNTKVDLNGIEVIYHRVRVFKKLFFSLRFLFSIYKEIKSSDIVHIQSIFFLPAYFSSIACRLLKIPYVVSPRGAIIKVHFKKNTIFKNLWMIFFGRYILEKAQAVVFTSGWEERAMREFKLNLNNTVVIHNGIDLNKRKQLQKSLKPLFNYIFFIGRISYIKGLDRLLKSMKYIDNEVKLLIAGNDEEGYRSEVLSLINELGLGGRVIFLGEIDEDKWTYYKYAQLTVLPSYSENFGNVIVESLSMQTPVVVTKEVGAADIVQDFAVGLVSEGDPKKLALNINKILCDKNLRYRLGSNSIKLGAVLAWPKISNLYLDLYLKIFSSFYEKKH